MSASPEELIAINNLLIEREAELARVHTSESRINALLDGDYPFEAPEVFLPSSQKVKVVKKTKQVKAKITPLKPRRLNEGEAAYRIHWEEKDKVMEQTATELKQVQALLQKPLPGMKLLKIETVDLHGRTAEIIFETTNSSGSF